MIQNDRFIWLHLPKCAGTRTAQIFQEYFAAVPGLVMDTVGAALDPEIAWHDSIQERTARDPAFSLGDRDVVCPIRRLPAWLISRYNFERMRNPRLPHDPTLLFEGKFINAQGKIEHADGTIRKYLPKDILRSERVKYLRTDHFEMDFLRIFSEYLDLSALPREELRRKANASTHHLPEDIIQALYASDDLYAKCPGWRDVEAMAYAEPTQARPTATSRPPRNDAPHGLIDLRDAAAKFVELVPAAQSRAAPPLSEFVTGGPVGADIDLSRRAPRAIPALGYYSLPDVLYGSNQNDHHAQSCHAYIRGQICDAPLLLQGFLRERLRAIPGQARTRANLPVRRLRRPAILFVGWHYDNYGHWWLDTAPRLYPLFSHSPELFRTHALVIPRGLPIWARNALCEVYRLDPGELEVFDPDSEWLECPEAIIPTLLHEDYDFHPYAERFYDRVMALYGPIPTMPDLRIFVSRREFANQTGKRVCRVLANHAEVASLAARFGFIEVSPEQLSWQQQVRLFSRAAVVLGEHGSALKNVLFAPKTCVTIAINRMNETQAQIAALKGQRYLSIAASGFEKRDHSQPYAVDIPRLKACLDQTLKDAIPVVGINPSEEDSTSAPALPVEIVLHIGMHKTGTTAIQYSLHHNAEWLKTRGILYPLTCRPASHPMGHHALPWELRDGTLDQNLPLSLLAEEIRASGCRRVILSSEAFSTLTDSRVAELHARLSTLLPCTLRCVCYLRRQDTYTQACYVTRVISGRNDATSWPRFDLSDFRARLDYRVLLERWCGVFGKAHLSVRAYERGQLLKGDAVDDFWQLIGLPMDDPRYRAPATLINNGMPSHAVELLREMRAANLSADSIAKMRWISTRLYEDTRPTYNYLTPDEARALLAEFAESNARVAREYLGREDGILFRDMSDIDAVAEDAWVSAPTSHIEALARWTDDLHAFLNRPDVAQEKPAPPPVRPTLPVFQPGRPPALAAPPWAEVGQGNLDRAGATVAPGSMKIRLTGKAVFSGWAVHDAPIAADTPAYLYLEAADGLTYFATLGAPIERGDVTRAFPAMAEDQTTWSGFQVEMDISNLPAGVYHIGVVRQLEDAAHLVRFPCRLDILT